jgi:phosphonate transport system ATP-binding protein
MMDVITPTNSFSNGSIIRMQDVWTSYDGKNYALRGINVAVENGKNYVVIGPSGSGKSTLLKLINGMVIPTKGQIEVFGRKPNVHDTMFKTIMPKIGYIPQNLGLVKNITVMENVLIGALPRISKVKSFFKVFPDKEISNGENALKLVGLEDKAERKTYMLSGGEKRRVAIARALVQKPELLLADEIVSELDHGTAREIMELVMDAKHRINLTAIMVHHDVQLALDYADKVAVIKHGDKIAEFKPDEMERKAVLGMFNSYES